MKWMKGISLKLFAVCFVFVLGSVSLVSTLSYRYIYNEIQDSQLEYSNQLLSKVEQFLDLYALLLQNTLTGIANTAVVWEGDLHVAQNQMERTFQDNIAYFSNVFLIKPDLSIVGGNPITKVFNEPQPEREAIYKAALSGQIVVTEPYNSKYSGWTVTMAKAIPGNDADRPLVIAVDLNLGAMENRLLKISPNNEVLVGIITSSGLKVARSLRTSPDMVETDLSLTVGRLTLKEMTGAKDEVLFTEGANGTPLVVMKKRMTKFDWTIFAVLDQSKLKLSFQRLQAYFIGLLLIGFVLSLIVAVFITRFIRRPVYYLIHKMRQVREGDLQIRVANRREDEFGELAVSFDEMLAQIRQLILNLNTSEQMKRRLEIQVLQSQINPHFLYNTLGSICNVVHLEQYEEVDAIVAALIAILEYGIGDSSRHVSLHEEIANAEHYMYIQNIRYARRFRLEVNVPPDLLQMKLPRMILQPIVENSLFHGYRGGQLEGDVHVSAFRQHPYIYIEITDHGAGMDEETAARVLLSQEPSDPSSDRRRIGLFNIHKRLQLYYGDEYGIQIMSGPGSGTSIRIRFPDEGGGGRHAELSLSGGG
jgi:two-component system sensor histidine kinase YesM